MSRSAFIFLAIVCFPELLHTLGLHKFVVSIFGVVSMNTACILKMILEWIHLGRPLCHRCKNFKALCQYTLFTLRMSRMLSRWRVLSVCLCNVPITVGQNILMFVLKWLINNCWRNAHWFTSIAFLSTFSKISPKRSLENLTSGDLRSFKLCFYVSWLLNCWKNCHLTWLVYSVPQKHPLARVNLLNFGFRTVIEIWSFAIKDYYTLFAQNAFKLESTVL